MEKHLTRDVIREKIELIKNWPTPSTVKEVQRFVGLANYYRRFIQGFASICRPLHQLSKLERAFSWGEAEAKAFADLRQALMSTEVMAFPQIGVAYELHTDASGYAAGAIISQADAKTGLIRPVAYASKLFSPAETGYSVIEREACAVIFALRVFRHYLYGEEILCLTDHQPLSWLLNIKQSTGRLARWSLLLQDFNITVKYKSGKQNVNADSCSRVKIPGMEPGPDENDLPGWCYTLTCTKAPSEYVHAALHERSALQERIRNEQDQDPACLNLIRFLEGVKPSCKDDLANSGLRQTATHYRLVHGVLFFVKDEVTGQKLHKPRLAVPQHLVATILAAYHSDSLVGAHLGTQKTRYKLKQRFHWPSWYKDTDLFVQACCTCQQRKSPNQAYQGPLNSLPVGFPWSKICIDHIGPLAMTQKGNRYILVITDTFSRYVEAIAVQDLSAKTTAQVLFDEIISRYGAPLELQSDRGTSFTASLIQELCDLFHIRKVFSSPYHPQTNGSCERFNSTLYNLLAPYVNEKTDDWDVYLPAVLFAYRITQQDSLKMSPFQVIFGHEPTLPSDTVWNTPNRNYAEIDDYVVDLKENLQTAWRLAQDNILKAQGKQERYHNRKVHLPKLEVGMQIWRKNFLVPVGVSKKLTLARYRGPYVITRVHDDNTVSVRLRNGREARWNVAIIKPATIDTIAPLPPPAADACDERDDQIQAGRHRYHLRETKARLADPQHHRVHLILTGPAKSVKVLLRGKKNRNSRK